MNIEKWKNKIKKKYKLGSLQNRRDSLKKFIDKSEYLNSLPLRFKIL
jgi:hypothetical protein